MTPNHALFVLLALQVLDAGTTAIGLERGVVRELNPALITAFSVAGTVPAFLMSKAALGLAAVGVRFHVRQPVGVLAVLSAAYLGVVINNCYWLAVARWWP